MSQPDPSRWILPRLAVGAEGEWLHDGEEITHPGILANLWQNLRRDRDGYFVQAGPARIPVEVRDTPFVVLRIEPAGEGLLLTLNDGSREPLDPATLRLGAGEVPFCRIKQGAHEARFSRSAAWTLLACLEYDEGSDRAVLRLGGAAYPVPRAAPSP